MDDQISMSYEGRIEFLCEDGHHWIQDAYDSNQGCPHCGKSASFFNEIDDTNFWGEEAISGYAWDQLQIAAEEGRLCDMGHYHITTPARYRIPTKEELKQWEDESYY